MRICARPGCTQPAVVRVGMDPGRLLVVLDDKVDEIGGYAVLCERHVQALTAPRGWWIADLRSDEPQLFRTGGQVPKEPAPPRADGPRRRATRPAAASAAEGTGTDDTPPSRRRPRRTAAAAQNDRTAAEAQAPAAAATERSDTPVLPGVVDLLRADSPLLARAFAGAAAAPADRGGLRSLIPAAS